MLYFNHRKVLKTFVFSKRFVSILFSLDKGFNLYIMFPLMNNRQPKIRLKIVRYYLKNGISLRNTALRFHIAYRTIFTWVKLYKEQGEERLLSTYKRPWNRTERALEEKIALMKENEPGLTVRKAKENLEKKGIRISIKGIWGIWKRYGYAGFNKKNMGNDLTGCSWTKEATKKFGRAKELFNLGAINKSAEILNSIPALPENELLVQIPDSLLNVRRRIEKMESLFGKIPVCSYLKKLRILYEECRKRNLYYLSLKLGIWEVMALSWSGEPMQQLKRTEELKDIIRKRGEHFSYLLFAPRFSLLISEGIVSVALLKTKEASDIARTCRTLLKKRKRVFPYFMRDLGQLYTMLEDFREAEYWYLRSLDKLDGDGAKIAKYLLADVFVTKGEYKKAIHILKNEKLDIWGCYPKMLFTQSIRSLVNGMPHKAISLAAEALSVSKKQEVLSILPTLYLNIASAYCSLGEKIKAKSILKRALPFLVKNRQKRMETIFEILLSQTLKDESPIVSNEDLLPTVKLALLLKNGDYSKAFKYAEKKCVLCWFHRYIFFFPEIITDLLEKGKPTGLPRAMLNLPVFRKEIPVYSVKFLGDLIVHKNQKYLRVHPVRKKTQVASSDIISSEGSISLASRVRPRSSNGVKLTPKDTAFLIHLAISKNRHISLDRIYKNFWPDSKNPSRNLAHLLVRIRKALNLPSHFLHIKENTLLFDCYFITDYGEYGEHLAQAKALLRADQWEFAKAEYLQAFSLFRGEPFRKIYDDWSEDMRCIILNQLESAALDFTKFCFAHSDGRDTRKVLQKISKMMPYSDEIKQLLSNLIIN